MCGIAGAAHRHSRIDKNHLQLMQVSLTHRGPDDCGIHVDAEHNIGFVHTRLSILDLSHAGHQPMFSPDGSLCLVYNGEIYNYKQVRAELQSRGHRFTSNTDTEVILAAYREWQVQCLDRFIGMFAVALWDRNRRCLLLARDRVGVKPLYYYWDGATLLFGSELKALVANPAFSRKISQPAVAEYLRWGYVPAPLSIFENTYKVKPGHYLILNDSFQISDHEYWAIEARGDRFPSHIEERSLEEVRDLMASAFSYRMVSDVPVGLFLSGGIDSSLVAAVLRKEANYPLTTFTLAFKEPAYDESSWARRVASVLGTDHHELICTPADVRPVIDQLPRMFDEPFADSSSIPTYLIAKYAREFVKVALSADGGDELFGGYRHYKRILSLARYKRALPAGLISETINALMRFSRVNRWVSVVAPKFGIAAVCDRTRKLSAMLHADGVSSMHLASLSYWQPQEIEELTNVRLNGSLGFDVSPTDELSGMLYTDFIRGLPDDMLTKMDRACMAVGLENREPLLDHRLVEAAFSFPAEYKLRLGSGKYVLRMLLRKYLPAEFIDRRKQGFILPLHEWFRADLAEFYKEYLSHDMLKKAGLVEARPVIEAVDGYLKFGNVYSHKLWSLLMLQMWWAEWVAS